MNVELYEPLSDKGKNEYVSCLTIFYHSILGSSISDLLLNMIGKVFRQSELNPARSALVFAHNLISSKETQGRRGRHRKNLYDTIKEDLEKRKLNFNTVIDEAKDPQNWKNITNLKSKPRRSERILSKNR